MKPNKKTAIFFALLALTIVGLLLRLHNLDRESLWLDEGASIRIASLDLIQIPGESARETYPSIYIFLLHFWIRAFGDSADAVRLLSVILGALCIPMIYLAGRQLFDRETGLLAAVVMAFSTFSVRYAQEARGYTLSVLLAAASFYYWWRIYEEKRKSDAVLYLLSSLLLILSHPYGMFIILAQNLHFFFSSTFAPRASRLSLRKWLSLQAVLFMSIGLWALILYHYVLARENVMWLQKPGWLAPYIALWHFSGSRQLMIWFAGLVLLSPFSFERSRPEKGERKYGMGGAWRPRLEKPEQTLLVLLWLLTPVLVPFIYSHFFTPIYHVRYTIVAFGAFALLAARGIAALRRWYLKWPAIMIVIALSLLSAKGYYSTDYKTQWRGAASFIDRNAQPGDLVIFHQGYTLKNIFNYYSQRTDLVKIPFPENLGPVTSENLELLDRLLQSHDRAWLVVSHALGDEDKIIERLGRSQELIYHQGFFGIDLYFFKKPG
jgi:uncharacterized membrane protein